MVLYRKDAFLSALMAARKQVAFLVGSPISIDVDGKGVPGITGMLKIIREIVLEEVPSRVALYDDEISGKSGAQAYQTAMAWLQANVHQDAVNAVVRRAVLKSCNDSSTVGDLVNPSTDGIPESWHIPMGTKKLAELVCNSSIKFAGPILTPNFDPLLSLAIRAAGGRPSRTVLDTDGALPREIGQEDDSKVIVHLHGYWRGADTLHTPTQLQSHRPKLKSSLQRLLRKHLLVVVAYGGWDDIFTKAIVELLHDDEAELDVMWCFRETDEGVIKHNYSKLFESVVPAIGRGRFRSYSGIDCHSIFEEANSCIMTESPASTLLIDNKGTDSHCGEKEKVDPNMKENDFIYRYLSKRLDEALESFSSQPKIWVEPIISKNPEVAKDNDSDARINLQDLLSDTKSAVIKAPPQFGLTCLGHYLAREAWHSSSSLWLYLDAKTLKPNKATIEKAVEAELKLLASELHNIKCVILDSWTSSEKTFVNILSEVCKYFPDVRVIVMQTINSDQLFNKTESNLFDREFQVLYLWTLPRGHVRKVVSGYNNAKHIGDEDLVTTKVVTDLEVLNLHRTPLNCLTLLKASEINFDESPVNRCEMIKRVLYLLFNVDDIPTYKIRPDLKDSEYVLGYFCEKMLRKSEYLFTRDYFLKELKACCEERIIELEVQVVFDVLTRNHILIRRGDLFCFRFTYWIYYFAAQRMHHNQEFTKFILEEKRYANYPEIIEFYTGIDRQRQDALQVLIDDIRSSSDKVQEKCGLPDGLNPYRFARWEPSEDALAHMKAEIADGVKSSNLPDEVKDKYADRLYDSSKPYDQAVRNILTEYSMVYMLETMRAGARGLRNSDYVDPEVKRQLLQEILRCWEQASKVLLTLLPLLAEKGSAVFDGYGFWLDGDFGSTPEERLEGILNVLPANIVEWFQEDLFSQKMGPLLIDRLIDEKNSLTKHYLILLLVSQRPRDWRKHVEQYIVSLKSDSFYLYDVYRALRAQYRYSFANSQALTEMKYLIKMAVAKHDTNSKMPTLNLLNKYTNAIPDRMVDVDS